MTERAYYRASLRADQQAGLEFHIQKTVLRICEAMEQFDGQVYVSFSGGKDSTVLLDLVAKTIVGQMWAKPHSVHLPLHVAFADTGLEYPEIRRFVPWYVDVISKKYDIPIELHIVTPTYRRNPIRFDEVVRRYGYPMISKEISKSVKDARTSLGRGKTDSNALRKVRGQMLPLDGKPSRFNHSKYEPLLYTDFMVSDKCCHFMKKSPFHRFEQQTGRIPITAVMAEESELRTIEWVKHGCNAFEGPRPQSKPMSIWTNQSVLTYIKREHLPMASVYGEIVSALNPEQELLEGFAGSEPLRCSGCQRTGCVFCGFGAHLEQPGAGRFERLKTTHPKQYAYCMDGGAYDPEDGLWKPDKRGLGMAHVIDTLNELYGRDFIRY